RRPLRAAAEAFLDLGDKWASLPPTDLVTQVQSVHRIGPWTAGAAVADHTGDFSRYPCAALAVRTCAAQAAPGLARQRTRARRPLEALHHHSPRTVDPHRAHPGSGRTPCTGVRPRLTPSAATTPTTPWTLFVNTPLRDYAQRPRVNDFTLPVLGVDYIATYAAHRGFNVGVLDAEALGLSVADTVAAVNRARPRWVGFNLLAPTYEISATIASGLDPDIKVMVGGHQAKAMPTQILTDERMARCAALVIGEAETRVAELLDDHHRRADLPGVMWLDPLLKTPVTGGRPGHGHHLAPPVDG